MTGRLEGKVALITGTGGGQGRTAALRFAQEGAKVVGCDLKVDGANETVEMVRANGGHMVSRAPVDLVDEAAVRSWIDFAVDSFGDFDILYNNASAIRAGRIEVLTREDFLWTMDNEVTLVFLAVKHALPVLKRRGGGVIINISSVAGMIGSGMGGNHSGNLAHAVAKAAVIRMTEVLAIELAPYNIRVNDIAPSAIETPAIAPLIADQRGRQAAIDVGLIPRIGQPDDVVNAALFLSCDESSWITGVTLPVDGGMTVSGGLGLPKRDSSDRGVAMLAEGRYGMDAETST